MNSYDWKQATRVAVFLGILFILCFIGYYVRGSQALHLQMLSLTFWGFSGMNVESFVSGLVQTVVAGYVGYGLWWGTKQIIR